MAKKIVKNADGTSTVFEKGKYAGKLPSSKSIAPTAIDPKTRSVSQGPTLLRDTVTYDKFSEIIATRAAASHDSLIDSLENLELTDKDIQNPDVLDSIYNLLGKVKNDAYDSSKDFSTPWNLFIRKMRFLPGPVYGARIEKWLINEWGWEPVSSKMNRGDSRDPKTDEYFEIKCSIVTDNNVRANFVQLRPHQDISGYHLFVIDANNDYKVVHFFLTKEQMNEEIALVGENSHGTGAENGANAKNREPAIRIEWSKNETRSRWLKKYQAPMPKTHGLAPFLAKLNP